MWHRRSAIVSLIVCVGCTLRFVDALVGSDVSGRSEPPRQENAGSRRQPVKQHKMIRREGEGGEHAVVTSDDSAMTRSLVPATRHHAILEVEVSAEARAEHGGAVAMGGLDEGPSSKVTDASATDSNVSNGTNATDNSTATNESSTSDDANASDENATNESNATEEANESDVANATNDSNATASDASNASNESKVSNASNDSNDSNASNTSAIESNEQADMKEEEEEEAVMKAEGEKEKEEEEEEKGEEEEKARPSRADAFSGRRQDARQAGNQSEAIILQNGGDNTSWHYAGKQRQQSTEDGGSPGCLLQWFDDNSKLNLCLTYERMRPKDMLFFDHCTAAYNQLWRFSDGCLRLKSDKFCLAGNESYVNLVPPSRAEYLANFLVAPGLWIRKQEGPHPKPPPKSLSGALAEQKLSKKVAGNRRNNTSWGTDCLAHDEKDSGHRVHFRKCKETIHQEFTWSCR